MHDMVAGYIGMSRVKRKEQLLVRQPFSPALFARGALPGPHLLMRLLRGDVDIDQAEQGAVAST